jgi:alpha-mannosidase
MRPIHTLYIVNHSHTDIGFTDYQDVCFRQHAEFIDQALDLIEATAHYPDGARYRWVCEVTGPLERYLRRASPAQIDRFRYWHHQGAIDVAGMPYNLTPLLNVEQMHRSLYPVRRLREEYGLSIEVAMQCDVNGISWLFADLLPAIGINFLTLAINTFRGGAPRPRPAPFWWEGPAGGRVLAWNGYHYLFGRSIAGLGDWRFVDRFLPEVIARVEADPDYPYDFL